MWSGASSKVSSVVPCRVACPCRRPSTRDRARVASSPARCWPATGPTPLCRRARQSRTFNSKRETIRLNAVCEHAYKVHLTLPRTATRESRRSSYALQYTVPTSRSDADGTELSHSGTAGQALSPRPCTFTQCTCCRASPPRRFHGRCLPPAAFASSVKVARW